MLFTPLLAGSAVGTLEFRSIAGECAGRGCLQWPRNGLYFAACARSRLPRSDPATSPHTLRHRAHSEQHAKGEVPTGEASWRCVGGAGTGAAKPCKKLRFDSSASRSPLPCLAVDPVKRTVKVVAHKYTDTRGEKVGGRLQEDLPFDLLIMAMGARSATFGVSGVDKSTVHFMKQLDDARRVRRHVLSNFETAAFNDLSPAERKQLLSFVVVGGGPTGVEFAAELHDFIYQDLSKQYPADILQQVSITLVEGREVLGSFDSTLREYCVRKFRRDNIDLREGMTVDGLEPNVLHLGSGEQLEFGLCVWSTGVGPTKAAKLAGRSTFRKDERGRIATDDWCRVLRHESALAETQDFSDVSGAAQAAAEQAVSAGHPHWPGVFALGDCANVGGKAHAATAQVAEQQGLYLAKHLNAQAQSARDPLDTSDRLTKTLFQADVGSPFEYKHAGSLAYVGSFAALADMNKTENPATQAISAMGSNKMSGFMAWLLWRSVYLTKLGSWRNRLQVPLDWTRTLLFGRDTSYF